MAIINQIVDKNSKVNNYSLVPQIVHPVALCMGNVLMLKILLHKIGGDNAPLFSLTSFVLIMHKMRRNSQLEKWTCRKKKSY